MFVKALVMDVDHTLYDHQHHQIPEAHLLALEKARKAGLKVFLCTGRPIALLKDLLSIEPGQYDGIVCGNGCMTLDENLQVLQEVNLPKQAQQDILELSKTLDVPLFCCGKTMCLTKDSERWQSICRQLEIHQAPVRMPDLVHEDFSLMEFIFDEPRQSLEEVQDIDGIRLVIFPEFIDVNPENISKVTGIRTLMGHYGFEPDAYIAFGDSVNDLEMVQDAKIGVAMGNASKALKEAADSIAPSVEEGGIYTWLCDHHVFDCDQSL